MNILILHALQDPLTVRRTTFNQTFCLPKYAPGHEYVLHCHAAYPVGVELLERHFDVIVLDTTFLCLRWVRPRQLFEQILLQYDFVRRSTALKIAFPQDDYDHSRILDNWLSDWGVSIVFSPLARFKDILFPRTARTAKVFECLTGHVDRVDEAIFEHWRKSHDERSVDVGWRARNLPRYFGRLGVLKSEIGERFNRALGTGTGLRLDVSNRPEATLVGMDWLKFLADCKFTLGSISGSSILDPEGSIQDRVRDYERMHPNASFEAVEDACFQGLDGKYEFAALGPRNLEAALAKSCQILVPNQHWTPLRSGEHFIALDPDCANIEHVLHEISDRRKVEERVEACYDVLVRSGKYSYESFVDTILAAVDEAMCTSDASVDQVRKRGQTLDVIESLLSEQRVVRMVLRNVPERELALRRELAVRTGRRGALREFFGANQYSDSPRAGRHGGGSVPFVTRLFFSARRMRASAVATIERARGVSRHLLADLRSLGRYAHRGRERD